MNPTGINLKPCNVGSAMEHNSRTESYMTELEQSGKKTYSIFHDQTRYNQMWINPSYEDINLSARQKQQVDLYVDKHHRMPPLRMVKRTFTDRKTGRKRTVRYQGWSPIREGCGPCKPDTAIEDFDIIKEYLRSKGIEVIAIFIHKDEGHEDPVTGERKYNYHFHVILDFMNYESADTVKLHKKDIRELQTVLADSLGMDRGVPKSVTGAKHRTPAQQREYAAAEESKKIQADIDKAKKELAEIKLSIIGAERLAASRIAIANANAAVAEKEAEDRMNTASTDAENTERLTREQIKAARDRAEKEEKESQRRIAAAKAEASKARRESSMNKLNSAMADVGAGILNLFGQGAVASANQQVAAAARQIDILKEKINELNEIISNEQARGVAQYDRGLKDGTYQMAEVKMQNENLLHEHDVIMKYMPTLENVRCTVADMERAGMSENHIIEVLTKGKAENVPIEVLEYNHGVKVSVTVELCPNKKGEYRVWFNDKTIDNFRKDYIESSLDESYSNVRNPGYRMK